MEEIGGSTRPQLMGKADDDDDDIDTISHLTAAPDASITAWTHVG